MSPLKTLSESTSIKKEEPHSKDIEQEIEYKLSLLLRERRRGLTFYQQAKSIVQALPEYGLTIETI